MPLPLAAIGAGLKTAAPYIASGVSSLVGWLGGRKNNREQVATAKYNTDQSIKANKELAQYAFDTNTEMWHRQNEYNSPQNQMKRLKSAGLNPHLVYGTGSVTGNTSGQMPQYQAPKADYNYSPAQLPVGELTKFTDTALRQAQVDNIKAQERNIEAKTITELVRAGLLKHSAAKEQTEAMVSAATADSRINTAGYQSEIMKNQADASKYLSQLSVAKLNESEKNQLRTDLLNEFQKSRNKWEAAGIMPGDSVWIRAAAKILPQLGVSTKYLREILGETVYKAIFK